MVIFALAHIILDRNLLLVLNRTKRKGLLYYVSRPSILHVRAERLFLLVGAFGTVQSGLIGVLNGLDGHGLQQIGHGT